MHLLQRTILYFNTVKYLKWTQIWHRFTFRMCHPKPDFSSAPNQSESCGSLVAFPKTPTCYLGKEVFFFLNNQEPFTGWNDANRDKLWLYNLHYFDWLRQENITEEEGSKWIDKWIADNPPPAGNGWEPYPLSLRIVNWIKWDLTGHKLSDEARHSLAVQIRFLRKRLEYHLLANHFLANAKALVFAGMFFTGNEAKQWLKKGLEIYHQQLPEQILPDGGHFELSPMYHSIILEDLLDLKNIRAPMDLDDYLQRMTYWLSVLTGPDGEIALFNDAAHGIALKPESLQKYANSLGIRTQGFPPSVLLKESGYARLSVGDLILIADCGEIGPSYQPGHAHADALSFEVWKGNEKVITNTGTCQYRDSSERKYQRSSAAHNTLVVDNRNSSEVWGAHRVARRGHIILQSIESYSLTASLQTYTGTIHQRKWTVSDNPEEIVIEDQIKCSDKKKHLVSFYYHTTKNSIRFSTDTAMDFESLETLYSPGFGVIGKKKTFVFSKEIDHTYTNRTTISF